MTKLDAKILASVFQVLLSEGAASVERLQIETGFNSLSVRWALFQLGCSCPGAELFILPDNMLPLFEREACTFAEQMPEQA